MSLQESRFRSFDGTEIYYQLLRSAESRGLILITHGLAEHSDCYVEIARRWQLQDWDVVMWDLRGHGQSEGQRGFVRDFSDYTQDLQQLLHVLNQNTPLGSRPLVLFGHSMGGLVTFSSLLRYPHWPVRGVALSSPLFGISVPVPQWKSVGARLLAKAAPWFTLGNEIRFGDLTHDLQKIADYKRDPLRHEKIGATLFLSMLEEMAWCRDRASDWHWPTLLQLAGDDRIVSSPASQQIFEMVPAEKKRIVIYEGLFHEIYNELGKEKVDSDLFGFLNEILPPASRLMNNPAERTNA